MISFDFVALHLKPLFASRKIFRGHTNLDNPGLINTGYAHVCKDAVINFALARLLDHNVLAGGDQRPKSGCLGLLGRVRTESEIDPGIGQVSMTRRIGDPEFPNGGFRGDLFQSRVYIVLFIPVFSASATKWAASRAS